MCPSTNLNGSFSRTALPSIIFIMITFARYSVMLGCWNANPKNRPTFEELSDELRQMKTKVTVSIKSFKIRQITVKLNENLRLHSHCPERRNYS